MTARLRAAAFAVWFYAVTFAFASAGVPIRLFARRHALWLAQSWVRVTLTGLRPLLGVRMVITGLEHLPAAGPALIASQHQSEFDTLIWLKLLSLPSYVMKQELRRIPLFGPLLVPAGMIPVDRAGGAAAMRQLLADTTTAARAGRQIVIFPEGTRLPPGRRVPLQPGVAAIATRTGLPVIPVATDSGRLWTRRLLARRAGDLHVAIGSPIPAGTPRAALLAQIEGYWRAMERSGFHPVDKIVEDFPPNPAPSTSAPG